MRYGESAGSLIRDGCWRERVNSWVVDIAAAQLQLSIMDLTILKFSQCASYILRCMCCLQSNYTCLQWLLNILDMSTSIKPFDRQEHKTWSYARLIQLQATPCAITLSSPLSSMLPPDVSDLFHQCTRATYQWLVWTIWRLWGEKKWSHRSWSGSRVVTVPGEPHMYHISTIYVHTMVRDVPHLIAKAPARSTGNWFGAFVTL